MIDHAFKIDFDRGTVRRWQIGGKVTIDTAYRPAIYVTAPPGALAALGDRLAVDPKVVETTMDAKYPDLHADELVPALRISLETMADVQPLAREIRGVFEPGGYAPGTFRLYDVDLSPQFRYCLDTGTDPRPTDEPTTLELGIPEKPLADGDVSALQIEDATPQDANPADTLDTLRSRLERTDPDVLIVSHGALVPLVFDAAAAIDEEAFALGRRPGYTTLAGPNTYTSYGQVGFSPARYDVPGRAIIDVSNSFLWSKTGLDGIRYFVEQAERPLQEVAWGSIGTILTAMQTREARNRDILVPWNKWEPESFKSLETLHAADRGGFTFAPMVGLHETVEEVDFASLYPNIMIEENVSPETVDCACHSTYDKTVPELGYGICPDDGFVPTVLKPMVEDRATFKRQLESAEYEEQWEALEHKAEAIKWILVSCFGYQGYRNAKFGRIEAHEAINAFAREFMMETKDLVETNGWEIVHGIVDSIWLAHRRDDAMPIDAVCATVSDEIGIDLEHEHTFDWICFVPRRGEQTGALNRYFGKIAGTNRYKLRGIECRQHSTPAFIAEAQIDLIEMFDRHRDPAPVCDRLEIYRRRLREGDIPAADLLIAKRPTKPVKAYDRDTYVAGALRRASRQGIDYQPGQMVRFVVTDDTARRPAAGVRLHFEAPTSYDAEYYDRQLLRAAESIVSPLGWDQTDIRRHSESKVDSSLTSFR